MENITIKINGMEVSAPKGSTILEAARLAHIEIPTLCFLKEINEIGACRICVVEVKGARSLVASCVYPISEGMEVRTNSPKVLESRKKTLQLLLSNHDRKCLSCVRSGNCELQQLCREYGVDDENFFEGKVNHSICLLTRGITIYGKYFFIYPNSLKQQAISRIARLFNNRPNCPYTPLTEIELLRYM